MSEMYFDKVCYFCQRPIKKGHEARWAGDICHDECLASYCDAGKRHYEVCGSIN